VSASPHRLRANDDGRATIDFSIVACVARRPMHRLHSDPRSTGWDLLPADVPADATAATPWRLTPLPRQRYYERIGSVGPDGLPRLSGYRRDIDADTLESDRDAQGLLVDRVFSVCP